MAFDERLAERIRVAMGARMGMTEKKMFGGIAFLLKGNLCCGVLGDEMIARIPPERMESALAEPHTRIFDMTGRPMKGWILVAPAGLSSKRQLARWIRVAVEFATSLPPKEEKRGRASGRNG